MVARAVRTVLAPLIGLVVGCSGGGPAASPTDGQDAAAIDVVTTDSAATSDGLAPTDVGPDDTVASADSGGLDDDASAPDAAADTRDDLDGDAPDADGAANDAASADASEVVDGSDSAGGDTSAPWPAPAPVGCVTAVTAGHHVFSCDGGITYAVEVPAQCTSGPCGLILDVHGWTMTAASEDANTDMRARGRAHGYVVVQPTASLFLGVPTWNLDNDAPRVFAFVADVAAALHTDPRRAHVMGFSQGGGMTWRLVCTHADFFASAAPISPITGCSFSAAQTPSREVPIFAVHGRNDAIVDFAAEGQPQVDAALAFWPFGAGAVIEEDAKHTATRWITPSGTVLELWAHDYEASSPILRGHCFPGSPQLVAFPVAFGCADQGTFDYAARALDFFATHPGPP